VEIQILACDNTASLRIVCDGTRYPWMRIWIAIRSFGTAEDASGTNACVANPINPLAEMLLRQSRGRASSSCADLIEAVSPLFK